MKDCPFKFTIGQGNWADEIRYYTNELNPNYWGNFRPLSVTEIAGIERDVARRLPDDFKEFLRVFGSGRFPAPFHGNIYEPQDFAAIGHGQLYFILGSSKWASEDDHRRFYATHGAFNPAPKRFTEEALLFEGVNLLDLLQIGGNGLCCYHHIYVGEEHGPLGYCLLTPEQTIEDEAPSFSEGLKTILTHHWFWNDPPEEEDDQGPRFESR